MKPWAERFYASDAWHACRDAYLASRMYLCERCSAAYEVVVAKVVHHKIPLTPDNIDDPYITFAWENLEALCQDCHNKEHHKGTARDKRYAFDDDGNVIEVRRDDSIEAHG